MRFNNRACALMDIPDLPQGAFEHCGDGKIKPQGGGGGGIPIISDIGKGIESVGQAVGGAVEDVGQGISDVGVSFDKAVTQPVGKGLSEVDTFVNREIPGGWTLPAVIAAAYLTGYLDPSLFAAEGATVAGTAEGAAAAGEAAYASSIASGATAAEATAAANAAATSYATGTSAGLLDAAALAEGGVTAGMGAAANTGIPAGTSLLGGGSGFVGLDAATAAELGLSGSSGLSTAGAEGNVLAGISGAEGAPIFDYSTEATLTPGGNVVPATTLPSEMAAIDAEIAAAAKAAPKAISPLQAIQGARMATGLLSGGQQQQAQALPQMGGVQQRLPQGAVDYSGLYNLLALQRARNPNSLLG